MFDISHHKIKILLLFFVLISITAFRIIFLHENSLQLFFDEAQYWSWSKNIDFGYYSKPPMIAWIISISTSICGDTEFCIRYSSPILHLGTALAIFLLANKLYSQKTAIYSALAYITLPAVSLSSMLISTDVPLLFFLSWSILFFIYALEKNSFNYWLLAGVFAGLAMLSKYSMLAFILSAFIYILCSKRNYHYIKSYGIWFASFVAFLVFLPNIIWNFSNDFASFVHTSDNASLAWQLNFNDFSEFFFSQFAVFGPIFFAFLLVFILTLKNKIKDESHKLLICFILPLFFIILIISILSRSHANWAAPIYVPATILVIAYLVETKKEFLIKFSIIFHIAVALLANIFILTSNDSKGSLIKLSGKKTDILSLQIKDPLKRIKGWQELGHEVSKMKILYPDSVILTKSRKIHSELLYYKNYKGELVKWNADGIAKDHFELTTNIYNFKDKDFLLITKSNNISNISKYFAKNKLVKQVVIPLYSDYSAIYYVYLLKNFKGYKFEL